MTAPDVPAVMVRGLEKSLGGRPILSGLSFVVERGAMLGLIGGNGGGKTTTLRILAGLLRPDGGEVSIFGEDIRRGSVRRRRTIGYMSQSLSIYPDLTVGENLRFRASFHSGSVRQMVERTAEKCELVDRLATRVDQLSSDWARRAQFAALIIGGPPLMLLDEPTAGLDLLTRRTMWRWMAALAAEGHCLIVSTHDLVEAAQCPMILHYGEAGVTGPIAPSLLAHGAESLEQAVLTLAEGGKR